VLTHVSDDIWNGGFGASAGFDICGTFSFDMLTVDAAPEEHFATVGPANPWLATVADVLGVGTVLVILVRVNTLKCAPSCVFSFYVVCFISV
jgi:hypothetical protein